MTGEGGADHYGRSTSKAHGPLLPIVWHLWNLKSLVVSSTPSCRAPERRGGTFGVELSQPRTHRQGREGQWLRKNVLLMAWQHS